MSYEKPIILADDTTSEGVFLASGQGVSTGDVTGRVTSADHYGNYYLTFDSFENGMTYTITLTVHETATVYGLNSASWDGLSGVSVSGNTVSYTGVLYANQTDWHVRLYFDSQPGWELGWKLTDGDIPELDINVKKL